MTKMCKNCAFWDHSAGRNAAGAAVHSARCKYSPDVVADVVFSTAQLNQYRFEEARAMVFNCATGYMEPKNGTNCAAFRERGA